MLRKYYQLKPPTIRSAQETKLIRCRPNFLSLCAFVSIVAFGAGGNLALDTTVLLEYLPSNKQYALTLLAAWWGIGQTFTRFMAWAFRMTTQA